MTPVVTTKPYEQLVGDIGVLLTNARQQVAVAVNNTLELLIDLCRSEMAADVAKVLFG